MPTREGDFWEERYLSALKWAKMSDASGQRNGDRGDPGSWKASDGLARSDHLTLARQLSVRRKNGEKMHSNIH